jgi:phytoene dehydrogenase-like protein
VALADGSTSEADVVVAGAPLPALYRDQVLSTEFEDELPDWGPPRPPGVLGVHLALRGARPAGAVHRTVVHTSDRARALAWVFDAPGAAAEVRPTVTVLRPDDPALRPDGGHEAVTVQVTVPPHGPGGPGGIDWTAPGVADAAAERAVAAAEAAVPGLRERELWRIVRTPADIERETGAPGGSVPAPALAGAAGTLLRSPNTAQLPGLYHVGGWAHPGGGLPHAGMSGAIVADLIAGGPGGSR